MIGWDELPKIARRKALSVAMQNPANYPALRECLAALKTLAAHLESQGGAQ